MTEIRTERLVLRRWRDSDLGPWAEMNADPRVREHLGPPLTREQSDASVARFLRDFDRRGHGWWAVEVRATGEFVGFAGLDRVEEHLPFSGVEAGWRLARHAWGRGYATEAARAALDHGFGALGLAEVLAVTTAANHRSQAVMARIGMTRDPGGDFDDPEAPEGPLRPNVLYRVTRGGYARHRAREAAERGRTS
ncbi:Protein N-acetyltransferase, RimJ/RimL family [Nocardiopsis flavescens]|uniref:Protein N-acetyltransferase, RimJ/RimL family n=1 Tax=Nocardiopsis flavescens TaxID=758803 RepID=A0A1M6J686_9ACTN|nr:GNAT family N-acetyltransferase [Nocardiopsis flavescens]SHJ42161.1 Protein N-acetyltransferase, RimJ/RimL family [Nocardiopsis flavescens]